MGNRIILLQTLKNVLKPDSCQRMMGNTVLYFRTWLEKYIGFKRMKHENDRDIKLSIRKIIISSGIKSD